MFVVLVWGARGEQIPREVLGLFSSLEEVNEKMVRRGWLQDSPNGSCQGHIPNLSFYKKGTPEIAQIKFVRELS